MTLEELNELVALMKRADETERAYILDRFYTRQEISAALKRIYENQAQVVEEPNTG